MSLEQVHFVIDLSQRRDHAVDLVLVDSVVQTVFIITIAVFIETSAGKFSGKSGCDETNLRCGGLYVPLD